jgi:type III secretion protein S
MSPEDALYRISEAMVLTMTLSFFPIVVASVVGILVSLLQALTQVQEQTLSFGIKLIAVGITLAAMSGNFGSEMLTFATNIFEDFPEIVR